MQYEEFNDRYAVDRSSSRIYAKDADTVALLEASRKLAAPLEDVVSQTVAGTPLSLAEIDDRLIEYERTRLGKFSQMNHDWIRGLDKKEYTVERNVEIASAFNELAFHTLNGSTAINWRRLAHNAPNASGLDREQARRCQVNLAVANTALFGTLLDAAKNDSFFVPESRELRPEISSVIGIANELDTALLLEYLPRDTPQLTVIASPGAYEHSTNASLNADIMLFDTERNIAQPIQVKSSVRADHKKAYDDDMLLFDGQRDLGNTYSIRRPRSSERVAVPWGGFIAVHFLMNEKVSNINHQKGRGYEITHNDNRLLGAKIRATQYGKVAKSQLTQAKKIVHDRVWNKLNAIE